MPLILPVLASSGKQQIWYWPVLAGLGFKRLPILTYNNDNKNK